MPDIGIQLTGEANDEFSCKKTGSFFDNFHLIYDSGGLRYQRYTDENE